MTVEERTPEQQAIMDRQNACDHTWVAVYYGTECPKCELFYPAGCAPWDEPQDEDQEEYSFYIDTDDEEFRCIQ